MARRQITETTINEHGSEEHPSWILVGAYRVSISPPGVALFDSDIKHQHAITVRLSQGERKRDINRDWIHGGRQILEFTMSEAQWASFVSSMNSGSGVPATLDWHNGEDIPGAPYDPRLAHSIDEVKDAARRAQAEVAEAFAAYAEKKTVDNLRTLKARIDNLPANIAYAAETLTEHAENVVQRAKADVEAFVINKAHQLGISATEIGMPELGPGKEDDDAV